MDLPKGTIGLDNYNRVPFIRVLQCSIMRAPSEESKTTSAAESGRFTVLWDVLVQVVTSVRQNAEV